MNDPISLTYQQKLRALELRFYQGVDWKPKTGDYYTSTRADLEVYKVVFADEFEIVTSYLPLGGPTSEWSPEAFLHQGFGPARVHVPDFILAPAYEPDDGPLTDEQLDAIRTASPASDTPDELFTESLFGKTEPVEKYEPDDGPLTDQQMDMIRAASPVSDLPESARTRSFSPKAGAVVDEISHIIREVLGFKPTEKWPTLAAQPLTVELANELRNKSSGNLFLMGADVADYIRCTYSEEYFEQNPLAMNGALHPWFDVHQSKSGREAGYVGMLMGIEVYTHPALEQNVFICLQHGSKQNAVIGYVAL